MSRVRKAGDPALLPYARWVGLIAVLTAEILTISPRLELAQSSTPPTDHPGKGVILEKVSGTVVLLSEDPFECSEIAIVREDGESGVGPVQSVINKSALGGTEVVRGEH